jgi:hypothetical protein
MKGCWSCFSDTKVHMRVTPKAERCEVLASSSKKLRFDRATGSKDSSFLATRAIIMKVSG